MIPSLCQIPLPGDTTKRVNLGDAIRMATEQNKTWTTKRSQQYSRQHYKDNQAELLKKRKKYRDDNREEICKKQRQYYYKNKEAIRERRRVSRAGR